LACPKASLIQSGVVVLAADEGGNELVGGVTVVRGGGGATTMETSDGLAFFLRLAEEPSEELSGDEEATGMGGEVIPFT